MPKGVIGSTVLTKVCKICGEEFKVVKGKTEHKQTCSIGCSYKLRAEISSSKRTKKNCLTCGNEFEVSKSSINSKYCSKLCMCDRSKVERACVICGKLFKTSPSLARVKACSTECGYKARRVANKKEKIKLECWQCGKAFYEHDSHANRRVYCSKVCMNSSEQLKQSRSIRYSGANNPSWAGGITRMTVSKNGIEYRRKELHIENEKAARRRSNRFKATPIWADVDKIRVIYKEAQRVSASTGFVYHVDHIVPLINDIVCGLHCEFNLQILIQVDNLKKGNSYWPNMP